MRLRRVLAVEYRYIDMSRYQGNNKVVDKVNKYFYKNSKK